MGIKQLMTIINEKASSAVRKVPLDQFSGRSIACDASMTLYQCLIATQSFRSSVSDESGNPTSHLLGLFQRTVQFIENGIKPIWVFDGRPPEAKEEELQKRKVSKQSNLNKLKEAQTGAIVKRTSETHKSLSPSQVYMMQKNKYREEVIQIEETQRAAISAIIGYSLPFKNSNDFICRGESEPDDPGEFREVEQMLQNIEKRGKEQGVDINEAVKHAKRTVHISNDMTEDAKLMLKLMGVPVIEAPADAEAQCTVLVNSDKAYAVASEDMDSLTFGAKYLLRSFSAKKEPIVEIDFAEVLRLLSFSVDQFIDFCILLGCDYCKTITGVGPATAFKLIQEFSCLEQVVKYVEMTKSTKWKIPDPFNFQEARNIFKNPQSVNLDYLQLELDEPNEQALREFLVIQKGFNANRVDSGLSRIRSSKVKPAQLRLDSFILKPMIKRPPADCKKEKPKKKRNSNNK